MFEKSPDKRYDTKIVCLDSLVPAGHLLQKIENTIEFSDVYDMVKPLYCEANGRPAVDPVMLVKMVLLQHIYGIKSLRQTVREVDRNIAYRWFVGYDIDTPIPHFATRFPSEVFESIFTWILNAAVAKGFIKAETVFIDATHIKANPNRKKGRKEVVQKMARAYDERLREEINLDRAAHGKKPLKERAAPPAEKAVTVSTTDPDCGLFHKGEHKVEFAYTAHVACDENNFVLACEATPGNVHDSMIFDAVYEDVIASFDEVETVAVDAGYKPPWICKKVQEDGRNVSTAYKRPMSKRGFFRSYEYVYDEYYDCVICPNDQVLRYTNTNSDGYREFKSDPRICSTCLFLHQYTESCNHQKVVMKHIWEPYIDAAEDFRHSPPGKESYGLRGQTIECVFADAKEKHGMRYTLHKGLDRVRNWIRLKFAAMNLKKLAMWA